MRLIVTMLSLPVLFLISLVIPYVGLLALVLLYFVRPSIWGAPAWMAPVEIFSWASMIGFGALWIRGGCRIRLRGPVACMMLLVVSAYLSTTTAEVSLSVAAGKSLVYLKCAIVAFLFAQLIDTPKKLERVVWALLLGTFWLVKTAIHLKLTGNPERVDRIGGQGGGANFLAIIIVITIPFILLKIKSGTGWERMLSLFLLPLWLLTMVLTGSRGGTLALGLVGFLFVWTSRRRFLAFGLAVICVVSYVGLSPENYKDRIGSISEYELDGSAMGRIQLWKGAMRLAADRPLLGVGPGNFQLLSASFTPEREAEGKSGQVAHSLYFQILAEQGLPALLLLLTLMGLTLRSFRMAGRMAPPTEAGDRLRMHCDAFRLGFIGFAAHSLFLSSQGIDVLWWWFGIAGAAPVIARRIAIAAERAEEEANAPEKQLRCDPIGPELHGPVQS